MIFLKVSMCDDFITYLTIKTVAMGAIAIGQLDESLALGGTGSLDSNSGPLPDDAVVFGLELKEEVDGTVFVVLLGMLTTILEKERCPGVDDEHVDKIAADTFGVAGRGAVEMKMVVPIGGSLDIEKLLDVGGRRSFQQPTEKAVGTADKLSKLADAKGGETIRTDAEKAPHGCRNGLKTCPLAKGFVVGLKLTRIVVGEIAFEQSRLPEKKSLDALGFVAPASQQRLWN